MKALDRLFALVAGTPQEFHKMTPAPVPNSVPITTNHANAPVQNVVISTSQSMPMAGVSGNSWGPQYAGPGAVWRTVGEPTISQVWVTRI